MDIALIGYGKMGHAIGALAAARGHKVVLTIDKDDPWPATIAADVAIEFSTPATAVDNIKRCLSLGLPTVSGTTGWNARYDEVAACCREADGALFTSSNFSIGMNIMFALNEKLAQLMKGHPEYTASIDETHHIHKLDAPSGTAITLRDQITPYIAQEVPITSHRIGEVPGTHIVTYASRIDTITLTHEAHSREGLAQGALLAAEWLVGRKGCFTMKDLLA